MTVKERLVARVARMSEEEAAETLGLLDRRSGESRSLREFVEANRLAAPLGEEDAEALVNEELRAVREERRGAA